MSGDWTKGGRWNRATIHRYGSKKPGEFCHLCFYKHKILDWDELTDIDWEFEVTEVLDNPEMLCMLYPFVDKTALLNQLNGWANHPDTRPTAKWATCNSQDDVVEVLFHE